MYLQTFLGEDLLIYQRRIPHSDREFQQSAKQPESRLQTPFYKGDYAYSYTHPRNAALIMVALISPSPSVPATPKMWHTFPITVLQFQVFRSPDSLHTKFFKNWHCVSWVWIFSTMMWDLWAHGLNTYEVAFEIQAIHKGWTLRTFHISLWPHCGAHEDGGDLFSQETHILWASTKYSSSVLKSPYIMDDSIPW
jgi:hypothetical protein